MHSCTKRLAGDRGIHTACTTVLANHKAWWQYGGRSQRGGRMLIIDDQKSNHYEFNNLLIYKKITSLNESTTGTTIAALYKGFPQ